MHLCKGSSWRTPCALRIWQSVLPHASRSSFPILSRNPLGRSALTPARGTSGFRRARLSTAASLFPAFVIDFCPGPGLKKTPKGLRRAFVSFLYFFLLRRVIRPSLCLALDSFWAQCLQGCQWFPMGLSLSRGFGKEASGLSSSLRWLGEGKKWGFQ